jgi:GT2 family glycosyltransferase
MRAQRLLPSDPSIALRLGIFWFSRDRAQALHWFERAAQSAESREIWLGLALLRQGETRLAAIERLLTRYVVKPGNRAWADLAAAHSDFRPAAERVAFVEGCVREGDDGGIAGWAWRPADPDARAVLTLCDAKGHRMTVTAEGDMRPLRPLDQPRAFHVRRAALRGWEATIRVCDATGRELPGSPVARGAWQHPPPRGETVARPIRPDPTRPVAIVVPVYRGRTLTLACLAALRASAPDAKLIVVDDATPEPSLAVDLRRLERHGRIALIRHDRNRGFPAAANAGLRAALALPAPHDVVLLNSDAIAPRRRRNSWLDRLRAAVHSAPDIASATPLSNAAGVLSYPRRDAANPPDSIDGLDALAARVNRGMTADLPTGNGFCLYLRHEALRETGLLRDDLFAQGYGEENDWCRRAAALGWRHVAAGDTVVAHCDGVSFGAAKLGLMLRNAEAMERAHPGYLALVRDWAGEVAAQDALARLRRNLDIARLRRRPRRPTTILVSHASGGGVERAVQTRVAEIAAQGGRTLILRPLADPKSDDGMAIPGWCVAQDGEAADAFPNLAFRLPEDADALFDLLASCRPEAVEIHHRLGHAPALPALLARLRRPVTYALHDYSCVCPRATFLGPDGVYCGEPADAETCRACVATAGERIGEDLDVADLRARSAAEFAAASRIVVPSHDMARRLRRYFPALRPILAEPEDDKRHRIARAHGVVTERVAVVIGAISVDKGFHILRACAEDAARRALPLRFRLVGMSIDDAALIATGRVFVTGRYAEAEVEDLVRAQGGHLAFLPSLVPETWNFALSTAWAAGLQAVVFDLGAQAERVRRSGRGSVLPLGLPAEAINNHLIGCGLP